jgi:hypothetical protein
MVRNVKRLSCRYFQYLPTISHLLVHSVAKGVPLIRKFPEDYENPSSPFQYDKSVSSPWPQQQQQQVPQLQPIPAATRFPKTLKEFLGLTTESEKYLFEKILERNSTFHQPRKN